MLEYIASKSKPVLLATGASELEDVKRAMQILQRHTEDIVLMQCNTNYTVDRENFKSINLNVLKLYNELYPDTVLGLSDHTPGCTTVLGALALGARVFEKHFTDDNNRIGPDHKFAMNPIGWRDMVEKSMDLFYALGDGIKRVEDNEKSSRIVQQRSVYFCRDMKRGEKITKADIFPVRPINLEGFYPYEVDKIVGKVLKEDVSKDSAVLRKDILDA